MQRLFQRPRGEVGKGGGRGVSSGEEAQNKYGNSLICSFYLVSRYWGPTLGQKYRNEQDEQGSQSHGTYLFCGGNIQ